MLMVYIEMDLNFMINNNSSYYKIMLFYLKFKNSLLNDYVL